MENEEVEQVKQKTNLLTSSKYEGLTAAIAAELMIGFWFGVGVVLAVKTLESLEYCIRKNANKMAGENQVQQGPAGPTVPAEPKEAQQIMKEPQ